MCPIVFHHGHRRRHSNSSTHWSYGVPLSKESPGISDLICRGRGCFCSIFKLTAESEKSIVRKDDSIIVSPKGNLLWRMPKFSFRDGVKFFLIYLFRTHLKRRGGSCSSDKCTTYQWLLRLTKDFHTSKRRSGILSFLRGTAVLSIRIIYYAIPFNTLSRKQIFTWN